MTRVGPSLVPRKRHPLISLDDLLDEAKPHTSTLQICVDGSLSAQRDALAAQLKEEVRTGKKSADDREGAKPHAQVLLEQLHELEDQIRSRIITIKLTQMPGSQWAALKLQHPVRPHSSQYDKAQGFDTDAVARAALLTHAVRVSGDDEVPVSKEQWDRLLEKVSGGDYERLTLGVLGVNQLASQMAVANVSKGSRRTSDSAQN